MSVISAATVSSCIFVDGAPDGLVAAAEEARFFDALARDILMDPAGMGLPFSAVLAPPAAFIKGV